MNESVEDALSEGLKRGLKLEDIRQQLLARGYSDYDIDNAIKTISPKKEEKDVSKPEKKIDENFILGWDKDLK